MALAASIDGRLGEQVEFKALKKVRVVRHELMLIKAELVARGPFDYLSVVVLRIWDTLSTKVSNDVRIINELGYLAGQSV